MLQRTHLTTLLGVSIHSFRHHVFFVEKKELTTKMLNEAYNTLKEDLPMLRRLTACLMALLMLAAVPARAAETADLAILSQWDERLFDQDFQYDGNHFRFNGCGPASVANALVAAMGITDGDTAVGITRDLMRVLTKNRPNKTKMQIAHLSYLDFPDPSRIAADELYPTLHQSLRDFGGPILYAGGNVKAKTLEDTLTLLGGRKALYHGTLSGNDRWASLIAMARVLLDNGYEDTAIVVGYLGAGTAKTKGPFRSGTAGHYLGIYIPVKEFSETGVFYVLDSLPRALDGEAYGSNGEPFMLKYDFTGSQRYFGSLEEFKQYFAVDRVKQTIVRARPIGEALEALNTPGEDENELPVERLLPYLDKHMVFFGTSHIFLPLSEQ